MTQFVRSMFCPVGLVIASGGSCHSFKPANCSFYINEKKRDQGAGGIQICFTLCLDCARIRTAIQQEHERGVLLLITITESPQELSVAN